MFFGSELALSIYFPELLLGTRSLEIEALGTALEVLKGLEVLEVDVLEDDAIFELKTRKPKSAITSAYNWLPFQCSKINK